MQTKRGQIEVYLLLPPLQVNTQKLFGFSFAVIEGVVMLDKKIFVAPERGATIVSVGSPISIENTQTELNKLVNDKKFLFTR